MKLIPVSRSCLIQLVLFSVILCCINFCILYNYYFPLIPENSLSHQSDRQHLGAYETPQYFAQMDGPGHPNCKRFRNAFPTFQGYRRDGDKDLAFTMVVHRDPSQIGRLMRMIHRPNNFYCIHVDRRSSSEFQQAITGIAKCFGDSDNVQLVSPEDRVAVHWGEESVLRPQLICGVLALQKHSKWTYLLNIAGQEFPLRTHLEMIAAVGALNGSNLVEALSIERLKSWVHGKSLPLGAKWLKGSIYGAFRREFLEAALLSERLRPLRDFLLQPGAFKHSDELFFPVLAYNPHLGLPGACMQSPNQPNEVDMGFVARFIIWGGQGMPCSTQFRHGVCILGREHVQQLKQAPHLIANKFLIDYHPEAYDDLEKWYFDKLGAERARGGAVDPAFDVSLYASRRCTRYHI